MKHLFSFLELALLGVLSDKLLVAADGQYISQNCRSWYYESIHFCGWAAIRNDDSQKTCPKLKEVFLCMMRIICEYCPGEMSNTYDEWTRMVLKQEYRKMAPCPDAINVDEPYCPKIRKGGAKDHRSGIGAAAANNLGRGANDIAFAATSGNRAITMFSLILLVALVIAGISLVLYFCGFKKFKKKSTHGKSAKKSQSKFTRGKSTRSGKSSTGFSAT